MLRSVRGASSRIVARVVGSRFAKPIARVALAAAGLLLLAFIGKTAVAGALGAAPAPAASTPALQVAPTSPPVATASPAPAPATAPNGDPPPVSRTRATPDDPVILNTASVDDFRRLPGVGEKRATAAFAVRARLGGRFHSIDDLLKVKGIGRTTLRRLRPLVRLDPPPPLAVPEAGVAAPR